MKQTTFWFLVLSIGIKPSLANAECFLPEEPFPYKLTKSDPLYETSRDEHQRYLEDLEAYVKCLDQERAYAFEQLRSSFQLFNDNFGKDAVYRIIDERDRD